MPRPVKPRRVEFGPEATYFKPAGVRMRDLAEVRLGLDEVEAIRLKDLVGLEQEECAARMGVAQSTFQRILTAARNKVASALIEGKALRVEGGNYLISPLVFTCEACNTEWTNEDRALTEPECPKCGNKKLTSSRVPLEPQGEAGFACRNRHRHGRGRGGPR
jgi:predicted DNA-binding protein (UPF0251 family)/predicted RNA-binding Zn-ribbon protein involved in translation (DUF1610 family)